MNLTFQRLMREATRLTSSGKLQAATAAIQRALGRGLQPAASAPSLTPSLPAEHTTIVLDGYVAELPSRAAASPGEFLQGKHQHAGLTRDYKLYVPAGAATRPLPLVVMLHGCTQDPDDFAIGTGMNELAREQGFLVLYPAQSQNANPSRCWNWFKHNHQGRHGGEAALIASLAQAIVQERDADAGRVYIAGLSAGGAMASLVAAAHPEVFAAVGVHSGLAPGAARSLPEALAAMRAGAGTGTGTGGPMGQQGGARPALPVPTIVFHGDQDATVHPKNGAQVITATLAGAATSTVGAENSPWVEEGVSPQGQRYTRTVHGTGHGPARAEHWLLHGAGHAWAGGQAAGSYTDTKGPDASREMLRFFFSQAAHKVH